MIDKANYIQQALPLNAHLLAIAFGLFCICIGAAWKYQKIDFRSVWGLQFKFAMASEDAWKELHLEAGKLLMIIGVWWLIPIFDVIGTVFYQVPIGLLAFFGGILWLRHRIGREFRPASSNKSSESTEQ